MEKITFTRQNFLPIEVEDLRLWCRIDDVEEEESLLEGLIVAALNAAESYTNRCLSGGTFEYALQTIHGRIFLPNGPIQEITKVETEDTWGVRTLLEAGVDYLARVSDTGASIRVIRSLHQPTIVVTASAGYNSPADIPQPIKQAIAVHAASAYRGREGQDEAHATFVRLLTPYRLEVLA